MWKTAYSKGDTLSFSLLFFSSFSLQFFFHVTKQSKHIAVIQLTLFSKIRKRFRS